MSIFDILALFGGLAMFLYGMRLMGDSLKENSSGTLKKVMERVTNNHFKAFVLGALVTALIQSSTATIVITSGLVGAGILTLHQSVGIIVGANVGTTVTGQIIRLLDLDASGGVSWIRFLQPSTLAPIALILGMVFIMGGKMKNAKSIGNISVGFGVLFSGLLNMTSAVDTLAESEFLGELFAGLGENPLLGYLAGAGVAFALQSSSASIGILQAFSSTGLLSFKAIYAVIVGIYLGDCVTTAIVCSIGAKTEARRVGVVNILYNLSETVVVLVLVAIIHGLGLLDGIWNSPVNSGTIANTNTIFNLGCAILLFPLIGAYERLSRMIIKDGAPKKGRYERKLAALSPAFFSTPALGLRSCYDVLLSMFEASRENLERSYALLGNYDEKVYQKVLKEEEEVDRMTDLVSRYMVEFLPRLRRESDIAIINQYYKVCNECESLGDHAVNIANVAANMQKNNNSFSPAATHELEVLKALTDKMLDFTDRSFRKRDAAAAWEIEPLVQVAGELAAQMRKSHFMRMSNGECDQMSAASFSNLMTEYKKVADVCSNIGVATMVRVRPELADHEHLYYENMHTGVDKAFNKAFEKAYGHYFGLLSAGDGEADSAPGGAGN